MNILHFEQVQEREVSCTFLNMLASKNEKVNTNTAMEKYIFVKCFQKQIGKSQNVVSITMDRHVHVAEYIHTHEPDTKHYDGPMQLPCVMVGLDVAIP